MDMLLPRFLRSVGADAKLTEETFSPSRPLHHQSHRAQQVFRSFRVEWSDKMHLIF